MKSPAFRLIVPAIIFTCLISSCDFFSGIADRLRGAQETNTWEDPKGDVPTKSFPLKDGSMQELKALDVVKVRAEGKEGSLHFVFTLSDSFDEFFSQKDKDGRMHTMSMVDVYIDTDNNNATGGPPQASSDSARQLMGYDVLISAMPSLKYKKQNGVEGAVSGDTFIDTATHESLGYGATYFIKRVPPKDKGVEFNANAWHANKKNYTSAKGNTFELLLPYEWLGLKAGDTIRLCYREMGQGAASGKSISEDKLLKLE